MNECNNRDRPFSTGANDIWPVFKHIYLQKYPQIKGVCLVRSNGAVFLGESPHGLATRSWPVYFQTQEQGLFEIIDSNLNLESAQHENLVKYVLPLFLGEWPTQKNALQFIYEIFHCLKPEQQSWVGIYWKEDFLLKKVSSDLVIGPYIGPLTPHVRISTDSGLCGLAVREERTINVSDVTNDSRFLACSPLTRSEIVIPIRNKDGIIGELDIDSNSRAAFDERTQALLEKKAEIFGSKF